MITKLAYCWCKVCGPYVSTLLNGATLFKWYMIRFVVKNIHIKDM